MTTTLALDASTNQGSVAVIRDQTVVSEALVPMRGRDDERLLPAVADALGRAGLDLARIDRIVCGAGPGSFTGLRIAASLAKGMALAADKPLLAASSLALIVAGNAAGTEAGRYLAALDALRGECFVATFERNGPLLRQVRAAQLVPRAEVHTIAGREGARVVGPAEPDRWGPHARGVAAMTAPLLEGPVSLASWEPAYGRLAEAQARWEAAHGETLPR